LILAAYTKVIQYILRYEEKKEKKPDLRWTYLKPAPMVGDKPLDPRPLTVKVDPGIAEVVRSLPNASAWLRRVIGEAAQRELMGGNERAK
jgi:hypothetical protein